MSNSQFSEESALQTQALNVGGVQNSLISLNGEKVHSSWTVCVGGKPRVKISAEVLQSDEESSESSCHASDFIDDEEDEVVGSEFTSSEVETFEAEPDFDQAKPKKLNPQASVFIRHWHPNMTMKECVDAIGDETSVSRLLNLGYPQYILTRIEASRRHQSTVLRYAKRNPSVETRYDAPVTREDFERPTIKSVPQVVASYRTHYDDGEVAKYWKCPVHFDAPNVPKPLFYSRSRFYQWVYGQAAVLARQLTRKTQIVTGNDACRALYFHTNSMTVNMLNQLLRKADVYVMDFEAKEKEPNPLLMSSFITDMPKARKSLQIGSVVVHSLAELLPFEKAFRRHRPMWMNAVSYFTEDSVVDEQLLQASLFRHFPPVEAQCRRLCRPEVKVSVDPDTLKAITNLPNINLKIDWDPFACFKDSMSGEQQSLLRYGVHITSFLSSVFLAPDWKGVIAAVTMFISGSPLIFNHCYSAMTSLFSDTLSHVLVFQSDTDTIFGGIKQSLTALWELVVSSAVISFLSEIKSSVASLLGPIVMDLVADTRRFIQKDKASEMAKSIMTWITDILHRLMSCVKSKSLDPLWGRKWDPQAWIKEAEAVNRYYSLLTVQAAANPMAEKQIAELRTLGQLGPEWILPVTLDDFLNRVQLHLVQGESLCTYLAAYPTIVSELRRHIVVLRSFLDTVRMSAVGTNARIAPMYLFFYGKPGTGKTNLIRSLITAVGTVQRIPCDSRAIYDWQVGANFQDGMNHTKAFVVMDDVDTTVAPPQAGVRNCIEEIVQLVNNTPYAVEQARVELKGLVFGNPLLVCQASNFMTGRAEKMSLCPHAFYRRIKFHVEVFVKPGYSKDGGLLDSTLASDSKTHDMWLLKVRTYKAPPVDDKPSTTEFLSEATDMSFPEFVSLVQTEFRAHLEAEKSMLERRCQTKGLCPSCGLSSSKQCACALAKKEFMTYQSGVAALPDGVRTPEMENEWRWSFETRVFLVMDFMTEDRYYTYLEIADFYQKAIHLVDNEVYSENCSRNFYHLSNTERGIAVQLLTDVEEWMNKVGYVWQVKSQSPLPMMTRCQLRLRGEMPPYEKFGIPVIGLNDVKLTILKSLAAAVGVLALAAGLNKIVEKIFTKVESQGREGNANNALVPPSWFKADQTFTPGFGTKFGSSTFTRDDILKVLAECYVEFYSAGQFALRGFCLGQNSVLVTTHVKNLPDLTVVQNGTTRSIVFTEMNHRVVPSNPELCVIRIPELKGTIGIAKKMWIEIDESIQQFDEVEICAPNVIYKPASNCVSLYGSCRILSTSSNTINGDCGAIYLARHNQSWKIVAMHYATKQMGGVFGGVSSMGAMTCFNELAAVARNIGTTLDGVSPIVESMTKVPKDLVIGKFGGKSEILCATNTGRADVHMLGELYPPLAGATMKTKIKKSILYDDLREFEKEMCGQYDYWKTPTFRGFMEDGMWRSPFINMFKTQNLKQPDDQVLRIALFDFLSGVEDLDTSGYSVMSEEQALSGITGSYVHAINMKTSVGPPYNSGKRNWMHVGPDGSYLSPEICDLIDSIEETIEHSIPSVLSVCSLKDEPMKHSKEFPRVFNNLPAAYNIVMKKYAVWKQFFRANFGFFESAVGINMTGAECSKVLHRLMRISPDLQVLYDGDITAMDKSWNGALLDSAAMVVFAVCWVLNVDPYKNYRLILGLKHASYYIKGDLFRVCHNPSGNDATVELNGIGLSLGERYVHYRMFPFTGDIAKVNAWFENFFTNPIPPKIEGLTFRKEVALVSYGDDNVKSMLRPPLKTYADIWRNEVGMEMQDAKTKEDELTEKTVDTISFLKRTYRKIEGYSERVAALDHKSMARMVLFKRDSSLTDRDHAAVTVSEFMREAVYWGKEFYDEKKSFFHDLMIKHGLDINPYYDVKLFEERVEEVNAGTFQAWTLREPVPPKALAGEFELQSKMSNVNLVKAVNFAAQNPIESDGSITHSVGVIDSTSSVTHGTTDFNPNFFQSMPQNDLNDFLTRATLIHQYELSNVDAFDVIPGNLSPWQAYLTNATIAEKVKNYTYIKGMLQLIFVVTAPGLTYGKYVLTALPNGKINDGLSIAPQLYYANCLQTDINAEVDIAEANDVVFQLPWIADVDYLKIDNLDLFGMWDIRISCLMPVSTAIVGGVSTCSIKVYANLMPGYELVVPHFQSRKLIANSAMKKHAPKVHAAIGEGRGSAFAGQVASIAEAASKIPIIGSFAETAAMAARGAESVLSFFGFTRLSHEVAPIPVTQHSVTNVAHCDGDDSSQSASLMQLAEISIDPTLAGFGPEDCLANADIFNRWTLIKTLSWSPTDLSGTVLGEIPVAPSYTSSSPSYSFTTAGFVGLPFQYWRGGMEYHIVIPVSKVHRGALQVIWVPLDSNPTNDVTNVSLNEIYDVTSSTTKDFTVGFAREVPFLENRVINGNTPIVPLGSVNGFLSFKVINPLMAQSDTAWTVISIFARAKPDMEFAVPRDYFLAHDAGGNAIQAVIASQVVLQGALGDEDTTNSVASSLVPMSRAYPADKILFGERVASVRELMQKPSKLNVMSVNGRKLMSRMFSTPTQSTANAGQLAVWTWAGYYRSMFLGIAASERIKLLPKQPCWLGASQLLVNSSLLIPTVNSTLAPMTFCGPNMGAEFNIPYYYNRKYYLGRGNADVSGNGSKISIFAYPEAETPVDIIPYYSLGPDIRATCFRQLPVVSIVSANAAYKNWWT